MLNHNYKNRKCYVRTTIEEIKRCGEAIGLYKFLKLCTQIKKIINFLYFLNKKIINYLLNHKSTNNKIEGRITGHITLTVNKFYIEN